MAPLPGGDLIEEDDSFLPTPEQWDAARAVLCGDRVQDGKVSATAAAREAGVTVARLRKWVDRSLERRPTDPPWIHEIAEIWDSHQSLQGQTAEDKLAEMAFNGRTELTLEALVDEGGKPSYDPESGELDTFVKTRKIVGGGDLKALMEFLRVRDERYRKANQRVEVNVGMSDGDLLERVKTFMRLRQIEGEPAAIEGTATRLGDFE